MPNNRVIFIKDYTSKGTGGGVVGWGVTHTPRNHSLEKIFLLVLGKSAPPTQDQTPSLHLLCSRCCLPAAAHAFPAVWMPFLNLWGLTPSGPSFVSVLTQCYKAVLSHHSDRESVFPLCTLKAISFSSTALLTSARNDLHIYFIFSSRFWTTWGQGLILLRFLSTIVIKHVVWIWLLSECGSALGAEFWCSPQTWDEPDKAQDALWYLPFLAGMWKPPIWAVVKGTVETRTEE